LLIAELWELGVAGIEEKSNGLCAYFEDSTPPAAIQHLWQTFAATVERNLPQVAVQEANDRDPILIGSRFVLVPADRIVLPIDAAMAFGSGRHETTQLCLEALEKYLQPGQTVYDVGCGSGILALAALKLGAGRVIAADINEPAITVARRHFPGPLFVGSADCLLTYSADLVLCNITGKVDDDIAADLQRIVKPDGILVVSGFTQQTVPQRFRPREVLARDDWECWICKPSYIHLDGSSDIPASHTQQWWL
jgi:ribosomal protein L11 methyltransferase